MICAMAAGSLIFARAGDDIAGKYSLSQESNRENETREWTISIRGKDGEFMLSGNACFSSGRGAAPDFFAMLSRRTEEGEGDSYAGMFEDSFENRGRITVWKDGDGIRVTFDPEQVNDGRAANFFWEDMVFTRMKQPKWVPEGLELDWEISTDDGKYSLSALCRDEARELYVRDRANGKLARVKMPMAEEAVPLLKERFGSSGVGLPQVVVGSSGWEGHRLRVYYSIYWQKDAKSEWTETFFIQEYEIAPDLTVKPVGVLKIWL